MQYPSHTIGSLVFGADGSLYASGGEGADYNAADWGQNGKPPNPCGDPPGRPARRSSGRPPRAARCARRTCARPADPTGLDGTIIRIDPQTGAGWPGNPFASSPDANARRIVAYGMRNPWRMTPRPGTDELWFSEVGWGTLEEINRLQVPNDAIAENFGWPCFEGTWRQPFYTGLTLCDSLMAAETVAPYFAYLHDSPVVPATSARTPAPPSRGSRSCRRRTSTPPPTRARSSSATTRAAASGSCSAAPRAARCPIRPT